MSFRYLNGWFEVKYKFYKIAVGKKGTVGLFFGDMACIHFPFTILFQPLSPFSMLLGFCSQYFMSNCLCVFVFQRGARLQEERWFYRERGQTPRERHGQHGRVRRDRPQQVQRGRLVYRPIRRQEEIRRPTGPGCNLTISIDNICMRQ